MGNSLFGPFSLLNQSLDDYQLLHQDIDRHLKFFQHLPTHKQIVIRQILIEKRYIMQNTKQTFLNRQQKLKHSHLFQILGSDTSIQPNNCNTIEKIVIMSEYSQRNLEDQTQQRSLQRRKYTEEELWTILASCILAFSHLEKNNIRHQCLKSSEIFISSDGIIKIKDPITTGTVPNLQQLMIDRKSPHLYISPELCGSLANCQPSHTYDPHKSDVFTLGMIILEAGLLEYQDSCYKSDWTAIDWGRVEQNWRSFKGCYSSHLADVIMDCMLDMNPKTRCGWSEMEENIKMYDERERREQSGYDIHKQGTSNKQNEFRQRERQREREKEIERQRQIQKSKHNSNTRFVRQTTNQLLTSHISPNLSPNLSPESMTRRANYHHQKPPLSNIQNIILVHKSSSNSPTLHPFKLISRKNYIARKPIQNPQIFRVQNSIKRRLQNKSPKYQMKQTLKFQGREIVSPASKKQSKLNKTLEFGQTRVLNRTK